MKEVPKVYDFWLLKFNTYVSFYTFMLVVFSYIFSGLGQNFLTEGINLW